MHHARTSFRFAFGSMLRRRAPLHATLLLLALLSAACGWRDTPVRAGARREASRASCIATELMIAARTRAAATDTLLAGGAASSPMGTVAVATAAFARASDQYATARAAELAYRDSALAAPTAEDSARLAGEAARRAPGPAMPGTVDANAAERWGRDFAEARANPDFPCNQSATDSAP